MNNVKDLITPVTAEEMVRVYNHVEAELKIAYQTIEDCKDRLEATFGNKERYRNFYLIPDKYFQIKEFDKSIMAPVREIVWKNLIDKLGLDQLITVARKQQINSNIEDDKMGPITVENMFEILDTVVGASGDLALELFKEAFDILRPGRFGDRGGNWKTHKTNLKNGRFDIGDKIILTHALSWWSNTREQEIIVIDKVFHLLDSKPFKDSYRSPLLDAINVSKNTTPIVGENEYFKWKGYGNGNLHLGFKRMDLVSHLNARCADISALKGE